MPQTYKGASIPAYSDTADGPLAFRTLIDNGSAISRVTSGQKPGSPVEGHVIYNTTDKRYEYWNGTAWTTLHRADGGPRGYVTEVSTSQGLTIPVSGGFTVMLTANLTNMQVGRRLRIYARLQAACGAGTDPAFAATLTLPNSSQAGLEQFQLEGAGFFRMTTHHVATWVTTGATQSINLGARVIQDNPWNRENAYMLIEDIGPA